jgi:Flp pilus assembly secretin CpaC
MKRFSVSVAIVAAGLAIWPARAERQQARPNVTLELGARSTVMLERPFKTVLIGNPEIVQTRTDRSVLLEPLNSGTTNLVFIDERGMVITNLTVLVRSARAI